MENTHVLYVYVNLAHVHGKSIHEKSPAAKMLKTEMMCFSICRMQIHELRFNYKLFFLFSKFICFALAKGRDGF